MGVAAGLGLTRAAPAVAADTPIVLVLGDSLSAEYGLARGSGWVALLERRLASQDGRYAVVNASISGETTAGGRSRIADLLARHRPHIVIVELGGNDALRGLELGRTERNLREITQLARRAGARVLLLGMRVPPNYGRQYSDQFAAIYQRVARAEKAALVPFFLDGVADRIDLFQSDRIHPTAQAQPMLLDNVWPALSPLL
jgi:acyl-CoA thioesterase-1